MPFLPMKNPMPPDQYLHDLARGVLNDIMDAYPVDTDVDHRQDFNTSLPQIDDIEMAARYGTNDRASIAAQYNRVVSFVLADQGGGTGSDANSRARTAAFVRNDAWSGLVATWMCQFGDKPITREFLGYGSGPIQPATPSSPFANAAAALADSKAALGRLDAALHDLAAKTGQSFTS